ncbi:hypothetical protein DRO64_10015 [Candidatus Bathyarchaeota archaeon]|nr:MAG: hypothetical protein DRO64_10015 [Candidatus Bathyarchaeota archaeon]
MVIHQPIKFPPLQKSSKSPQGPPSEDPYELLFWKCYRDLSKAHLETHLGFIHNKCLEDLAWYATFKNFTIILLKTFNRILQKSKASRLYCQKRDV